MTFSKIYRSVLTGAFNEIYERIPKKVVQTLCRLQSKKLIYQKLYQKHIIEFFIAPFQRVGEKLIFSKIYRSVLSGAINEIFFSEFQKKWFKHSADFNRKNRSSSEVGLGFQNSPCFLMILSLSLVGESVFSNILPKMDKGCIFLDSETILNFGDVKALLENQIWGERKQSKKQTQKLFQKIQRKKKKFQKIFPVLAENFSAS